MADGLYPKEAENAIQKALHREKGASNPPMILDVGSGSGTWYEWSVSCEIRAYSDIGVRQGS